MEHDCWCDGDHDDEEECDVRCTGHFGEPDCTICPNKACIDHSSAATSGNPDDHTLCDGLHCTGHEWDGASLDCQLHAAWCHVGFDEETTDCWGNECTRKLPGGLILKTQLADGSSEIDIEGTWGPRTAEEALVAAEGMRLGATYLTIEENYLAQQDVQ